MKPKQILVFFTIILTGLGLLMLAFPKNGIKVGENFTINFITWDEFLNPVKNKDITNILENNQIEEDSVSFFENEIYDSVYIDSVLVVYKPIQISVDSTLQKIEFAKGCDTLLDNLFLTFAQMKSTGEKIHILHYGDSQIEVDRMTDYIRMKLQSTFGGSGSGFHSGIQAFDFNLPLVVTYSDNWYRYKVFPQRDTIIGHKRFGITTSFSMFKSVLDSTDAVNEAWIQFEVSPLAYSSARYFSEFKLFYGYNKTPVNITITDDSDNEISDVLPADSCLKIKTWSFPSSPKSLKIYYSGNTSPEIYGYSFESASGVMVDNLPIRGSGGTFFGLMDLSLTGQMYNAMNVKLILLQFGGNVIGRDSANIMKYCSYLSSQMKYLKNIAPNARIIVIGPADMSEKNKNNYITRPLLPFLIEEMKKVTFQNECGFWNMYEAMGGENSMPSWVFHEPPLAESDFIHFTPQGAKIVAQMFYKALIYEYNNFIINQSSR